MTAHYVVRRFGFRLSRGWFALIMVVGGLTAAAFWVGPFRPLPARLQLLALSGDGRYREYVGIPSKWADTLPAASEATARFPLILAIQNAGAVSAQPSHLALNLPARYRITNARGEPLPFHTTMGSPLVRYNLPIRSAPIDPKRAPAKMAGLDTLWLEPIVPTLYCTAFSDSIPEFVSAPPQNAEVLSRVRMFYSFSGPRIRARQTGLLTVQVDPNLVKREPSPNPPVFETEVVTPEPVRPAIDSLKYVGQRTTWCGDPGQPMQIGDVLFETRDGGRYFVVYHAGRARKWMFDLNRDSIIELEMWDGDGDGKFESRRTARMAIPSFLMPYTAADTALAAELADTVPSTPQWLATFYDTVGGVMRFSTPPTKQKPTAAQAAQSPPNVTPSATPGSPNVPIDVPANVPVDSAWLQLFNNTGAGVLRFSGAASGKPLRAPPPVRKAPARRRDNGPKLLGVPVDSIRR
ncbi:MAG TPA: hypothetical protein VM100_04520 [Longimicrobiales bacterium]|nr:hypothetical protein [Longimicrobiales bacterium]